MQQIITKISGAMPVFISPKSSPIFAYGPRSRINTTRTAGSSFGSSILKARSPGVEMKFKYLSKKNFKD
ncbi:hypothetical protein DK28_0201280 [Peptococcaceae bacterium SCADC1_2_3]|jgi:hypothetical protein|nr:hypothetical protein DK28_0201280 [Peptococcaceae bacterium SCADC1_2_3]KFI36029.1 hypothetical protein HY00_09475 [Peptococcaceae bacterium SCADC1_2_3]